MKNEIILYRPDALSEHIGVRVEDETFWINRHQISGLFDRDVKTIGKCIITNFTKRNWISLSIVKSCIGWAGSWIERRINDNGTPWKY